MKTSKNEKVNPAKVRKHHGLGMGLSALLGDDYSNSAEVSEISINQIVLNEYQPRRNFNQKEADELAASVMKFGVLQPVLASKLSYDKYQLVAGERRLRAAIQCGLEKIPVRILNMDLDDKKKLEISLLENIQREDLDPIEEAQAYETLIERFSHTHDSLASHLGKSRSHISNLLRLIRLPQEMHNMIKNQQLTVGHAKVLASHKEALEIAYMVIKEGWSVRQLERFLYKQSNHDTNDNIIDTTEESILKKQPNSDDKLQPRFTNDDNNKLKEIHNIRKMILKKKNDTEDEDKNNKETQDFNRFILEKLADALASIMRRNVRITGNDKKIDITIECSSAEDLIAVIEDLKHSKKK